MGWFVGLIALIWIGMPIYERMTRSTPTCPKCDSEAIETLSKETEGKPIIHGGRVSATVTYHYRFHCKHCGERWEKTEAESR